MGAWFYLNEYTVAARPFPFKSEQRLQLVSKMNPDEKEEDELVLKALRVS